MNTHIIKISQELSLPPKQVASVSELLSQDATIPFIARYRKEATGSLDEVVITDIRNRLTQLEELDSRKDTIIRSLEKQGISNDELLNKINSVETMAELEDLYLPYKPKRRTKATIAREKGLEPLAMWLLEQQDGSVSNQALAYVDEEKKVSSSEDALAGARDILAELISEDTTARADIRNLFWEKGTISSAMVSGKEEEGKKYKDYFNWEEPVKSAPSHRILAMRRGEKEDILNVTISPPEETALQILTRLFVKAQNDSSVQVELALKDGYKRLLSRAMETETRILLKDRADKEAISVFSENLRQLLLAPPLGAKRVLGIDPGFRTGCKVVCLDRQGKVLHYDTIFPNMNEKNDREARDKIMSLCLTHHIEAIAVGNGTAGRETEAFIRKIPFETPVTIILVNESGASVYSASEIAREEFPDLDLTIRGAISIGRRLMDPLSELVKIDPKSIGVGQYQHDVDQSDLKTALDDCVVHCVNAVGVDLNRASAPLLTYVSGLGPVLAKNIVQYRNENGPFVNRKSLTKVPRLGPKAFEQCAGFLRVPDSDIALDRSAVHPESYPIVDHMARDLSCGIDDLMADKSLRDKIDINRYITDKTGLPTLRDILDELAKPGRDPREEFQVFSFAAGIEKMTDLTPGMKLPGIVTNITAFGAFVDVGVHQDGLVHISEMADRFIKDPSTVVSVGQHVDVRILDVDIERKRISLSMKSRAEASSKKKSHGEKPKPDKKARNRSPVKKQGKPAGPSPFNNPFAQLLNKEK